MTNFVTCDVFGNVGQQLAQVCSVIEYGKKHGKTPVFRRNSAFNTFWRTLFSDRLNALDDKEYCAMKFDQTITNTANVCFADLPHIAGNVRLSGNFNMKNIPHCRDRMIELAYSNEDLMYEAYERFTNIKDFMGMTEDDDIISVYVDTNNQGLIDSGFYKKAYDVSCKLGNKKRKLVVFTNDIDKCRTIIDMDAYCVDFNDSCSNFILLSLFDHNIIGESLTALYASFISPYKRKIVISHMSLLEEAYDEEDEEDEWTSYLDNISYV